MSLVSELLNGLESIDSSVSGLVGRSDRPQGKDRFFFYAYSQGKLKYIISSQKDVVQGARKLEEESTVISSILSKIRDQQISKTILYPMKILKTDSSVFSVSRYTSPAWRFRFSPCSEEKFLYLLEMSSTWILAFQKETSNVDGEYGGKNHFYKRWCAWKQNNSKFITKSIVSLVGNFMDKFSCMEVLPKSACHGDYCYTNYFFDQDGVFRVYDWEFSSIVENVALDYLSNIIVFAFGYLKPQHFYSDLLLHLEEDENAAFPVRELQASIKRFQHYYNVPDGALRVCFIYSFFHLLFRCQGEEIIRGRIKYTHEFANLIT